MSIPQSIQSQVVAYVVGVLNTAGATSFVAPVLAFRTRVESFAPEQLPAWNVLPDEGMTQYVETAAVNRKFRFCVRSMVAAYNEADLYADQLYVVTAMAIAADPSMGGLVRYAREISQKWERDGPASEDNIALVTTYEVEFATLRTDPTTQVP
jgi:hypothetical protein